MGNGPLRIYTVDGNGSTLTKVAQGTDPAWSPDGSQISYTYAGRFGAAFGSESEGLIRLVNPDGSNVREAGVFGTSGPWNPRPRTDAGT
jgi:Tol biopolymer transport system component